MAKKAGGRHARPKTLRAQRLELIDDAGAVRLALGLRHGAAEVCLHRRDGTVAVHLQVLDEPFLTLLDPAGRPTVLVSGSGSIVLLQGGSSLQLMPDQFVHSDERGDRIERLDRRGRLLRRKKPR
jgi:hypothetical protein